MNRTLADYEDTVGAESLSQLRELADDLAGAKIVHVNSTREGGGVAEILGWLVPLMRDLGLDASWEVIEGKKSYFTTTKAIHNGLQGMPTAMTEKMIGAYESTIRRNAERLRPILEEADFVIIHDPQPAGLLEYCPGRRGKWIWRCHVVASRPARQVWSFLKSKIIEYDASIFSMPEYAQPLPHAQFIIAPSIDPLSEKNCDLTDKEIAKTLDELGIPRDLPILTQISRFDRFKDPLGVIEAFRLVRENVEARLVLMGGGASDDPEGAEVFESVQAAAEDDPLIHVLMLPSDAHRTVNALQRASTVVIQKSIQEGFGLTVTESLWKSKPVVAGNVGGLRAQVHN